MNNTLLVQNLRPLPRAGRVRLGAQVDRLHRVCGGDGPLEPFLEELLDVLSRIFGAAAGAFWFRPWGASGLCPSIRVGFAALPLTSRGLHAIDGTVADHWQSPEPAVQSYADHASTVLVGPIRDGQEAIGAMQLVIIDNQWDRSPEFESGLGTTCYARALDAVMAIVQPALLRRMRVRTLSLTQADQGLEQLDRQVAGIQRSIRLAIEHHLQQLSGATFGTLDDNQQFVRGVQKMLDSHGFRVRCPECGHAAILRCSKSPSVPGGVFVFDHYLPEGRTFHGGGRTLPMIRLTAKPARKKASVT